MPGPLFSEHQTCSTRLTKLGLLRTGLTRCLLISIGLHIGYFLLPHFFGLMSAFLRLYNVSVSFFPPDFPGKQQGFLHLSQQGCSWENSCSYGTPCDRKFNIWNKPCNLTENDSTCFKTIEHGENAPTCIRQNHLARYRRMHVESFLHVRIDAFWPFTYVAIEGENIW